MVPIVLNWTHFSAGPIRFFFFPFPTLFLCPPPPRTFLLSPLLLLLAFTLGAQVLFLSRVTPYIQVVVVARFHSITQSLLHSFTPSLPVRHLETRGQLSYEKARADRRKI